MVLHARRVPPPPTFKFVPAPLTVAASVVWVHLLCSMSSVYFPVMLIIIMTDGWGLLQWPTSPITTHFLSSSLTFSITIFPKM